MESGASSLPPAPPMLRRPFPPDLPTAHALTPPPHSCTFLTPERSWAKAQKRCHESFVSFFESPRISILSLITRRGKKILLDKAECGGKPWL